LNGQAPPQNFAGDEAEVYFVDRHIYIGWENSKKKRYQSFSCPLPAERQKQTDTA
jgi:hypothetical protein